MLASKPPLTKQLLTGFVVATTTLLVLQLGRLLLSGAGYFEWGFPLSLAIAWGVVTVGWLTGLAVILGVSGLIRKLGIRTQPNVGLLAGLTVVLMYASTEVPSVSRVRALHVSPLTGLCWCVGLAILGTLLTGYRRGVQVD